MNIIEKKFVSIGGGIGSFCFTDALRIHGIFADEVAVISKNPLPYHQLKSYSDASGLYHNERIRSDSSSRVDNYWGYPGYALTEIINEIKSLHLTKAVNLISNILAEPLLYDFYTPSSGTVYQSITREMTRIGWKQMVKLGEALSIKKLPDGRFGVIYKSMEADEEEIIIGNFIHLSLGHSSKTSSINNKSFWIYDDSFPFLPVIESKGGSVLVIGRGIAAAKVVERLIRAKLGGSNIEIVSVFRSKAMAKDSRGLNESTVADWRLQHFNWPRAAFGGSLKNINDATWNQPSTPPREEWIDLLKTAALKKFYKILYSPIDYSLQIFKDANFVIDCTGFDDKVISNNFYKNLFDSYHLKLNPAGGFETTDYFELDQLSSPVGKVFVTGVAASGNKYGPVDSFMGQQYAATQIIKRLNIPSLTPLKSLIEWSKWATNTQI